jgi:hypothetical protein
MAGRYGTSGHEIIILGKAGQDVDTPTFEAPLDETRAPRHEPDQLVVDTRQLPLVKAILERDFGITEPATESSELLGLTRITQLGLATASGTDVSELLRLIKHRVAAERGGLVLTAGVNSRVDAVVGASGHKPMAAAFPMLTGEPLPPPAAAGTGLGVTVGIVDTTFPAPAAPADGTTLSYRAGHATFVRSLIEQQARDADIHVKAALGASGKADGWTVATAIAEIATSFSLDVLNLSLGCFTYDDGPPLALSRAIERVPDRTLIVAAAGNHGSLPGLLDGHTKRSTCWPAAIPGVVAVGTLAADSTPEDVKQADYSPNLPWVSCVAVGEDVIGRYLTGRVVAEFGEVVTFDGTACWSGSSFAAARVSGLIAARMNRNGEGLTARQAYERLLEEGAIHPWRPATE